MPGTVQLDVDGAPLVDAEGVPVTYDDGVPLPHELEHAVHIVTRAELDLMRRGGLGVTSECLGDASRSYEAGGNPGLAMVRPILAAYRRLPL